MKWHGQQPAAYQRGFDKDSERTSLDRERRCLEGQDAMLTELAAPEPAPQSEARDTLENEEHIQGQVYGPEPTVEYDNKLTEVAVPEPVYRTPSSPDDLNEEEKAEPVLEEGSTTSAFFIELATISWLIFFSLLGTLARLGVQALTNYPYSPFPSTVLWANVGGSLFLGFLIEDRRLFLKTVPPELITDNKEEARGHIDRTKKASPLYIGLATGFCGSFTSFSTFITDAFLALSNNLPPPSPTSPYHTVPSNTLSSRNGGYSLLAVLAILITQSGLSIGALKTGAHLALGLDRIMPSAPADLVRHSCLGSVVPVVLGFGCWLGSVFLVIFPPGPAWRFRATMPLVFSPPGVLLRFYLSKYLNGRVPSFPLGTFAANIFGTCIEGMSYDLQHSGVVVGHITNTHATTCALLEGVSAGFCGCTTTVSTWVAELNGLRRRHGWVYGLTTVAVALGFQVAIMGGLAWTRGFKSNCDA